MKAKNLLSSVSFGPKEVCESSIEQIRKAIREEIEIESANEYPDYYVISRLSQLLGNK